MPTPTTTRRDALSAGLCGGGALLLGPGGRRASAQPGGRVLTMVVPYAAGGGTDILARLVGGTMAPALGQSIVIENRPGAATNLGAEAAARSAPDGYTLGPATIANLCINQFAYKSMGHDPERDLVPVALTCIRPYLYYGS